MSTLTPPAPPELPTQPLPAPRYRKPLGADRGTWLQYLVLIVLAVLVLAPVVPTLIQSFLDRPLYQAGGIFTPLTLSDSPVERHTRSPVSQPSTTESSRAPWRYTRMRDRSLRTSD